MIFRVAFYKEFLFSSSIFEGNNKIFLYPLRLISRCISGYPRINGKIQLGSVYMPDIAGYAGMNAGERNFAHKKGRHGQFSQQIVGPSPCRLMPFLHFTAGSAFDENRL